MKLKTVRDIKNIKGKTVLCRIDLNVKFIDGALDEFSEFKIKQVIPTVAGLLKHGARVILISHFGRPKQFDKRYSLRPFVSYFKKWLGHRPGFLKDLKNAKKIITNSEAKVFLLENLRFWNGEEENDAKFARTLAALGDLYINDAFAVSHRAHASVSAITKFLPSYAGLLLRAEIQNLTKIVKSPMEPFVALLGGAKVSTKVPVIQALGRRASHLLLGGALAHPFLVAKGYTIGRSFIEEVESGLVKKLLSKKIILPIDVVVVPHGGKKGVVKPVNLVERGDQILDIGPATVLHFAEFLRKARTIVWNGPMGYFEKPEFAHGSVALARFIAARSRGKAFGVIGGGETVAVLARTGMQEHVDWVSTGGGAMLEFLAGKMLPGIKPLIK